MVMTARATAQPSASQADVFRPSPIKSDPGADGVFGFLRAMVRNPASAIPPAAYSERVVFGEKTGKKVGFVCDPAIVEEILVKRPNDFPKSLVDERIFRPAFGNSLLIAQGEDWRWKRRLAAPYFVPAALAKLVPGMVAPFDVLTRTLSERNEDKPFDVSRAMTRATLEVITATLFTSGDELDMAAVSDAISDYLMPISWTIGLASIGAPEWLPHPGKAKIRSGRDRMRELVGAVVSRRRQSKRKYDDICAELMNARDPETGKPLSDADLVDMLLTLVAAGHETSANALTWALYCLAVQSHLQEELRAEVKDIAGDRPIKASDLPHLHKTEAFLKEAMRLFPPVPLMARQTTKTEDIGSHRCAPGMTLFIPIYAIHRHESIWDSPDTFDLSRFAPDKAKQILRTAYMPFGAGPRICIGNTFAMMEMVAALATTARGISFGTSSSTRCEPIHRITLRPKHGMSLDTKPRVL
ncbi:MAG: cytochrome P450 [Pseudolabrys sp.]